MKVRSLSNNLASPESHILPMLGPVTAFKISKPLYKENMSLIIIKFSSCSRETRVFVFNFIFHLGGRGRFTPVTPRGRIKTIGATPRPKKRSLLKNCITYAILSNV